MVPAPLNPPLSPSRREKQPRVAFGGAAPRKMSSATWWSWIVLSGLILLNGNAIILMAGGSERLLTFPLVGLCFVVLWSLRDETLYLQRSPASWAYLFAFGFLTIGFLSAFTSTYGDLEGALGEWGVMRYFASLLLMTSGFVVATRAMAAGRFDSLVKWLFWLSTAAAMSGFAISAIPALADSLTMTGEAIAEEGGRLHGVFANVNELGLQSGYPVVFGLMLSLRSRNIFWVILGVIAGGMGVIASFSKAAMIMILFLMVQVFWEGWKARSKSPLVGWAVAIMGVGALIWAVSTVTAINQGEGGFDLGTDQKERFEQLQRVLTTGVLDDQATTGRSEVWSSGIQVWWTSPLIGCGLTTFDLVPGVDLNAHNSFLVILGESGLLGFLLFGCLLVAMFTSIVRCGNRDVRVLGVGYLLAEFPLWMTSGQAMSSRGHNLVTGCVLGFLVMALVRSRSSQKAVNLPKAQSENALPSDTQAS